MNTFDNMIWENNFIEDVEAMPQTVPVGCRSPPSSCAGERAVPSSPADLQHLLRALGAASPPVHMLPSPPQQKPPPPYLDPTDQHYIDKFYDFECYPTPSPASEDSIPTLNFQPASPFNPLFTTIKEEPHRLSVPEYTSPYPLSPSGSCVSYTSSPNNYSVSPAPHHDEYIDIEALLKENQILQDTVASQHTFITPKVEVDDSPRDHALLRTALEDTSFQKKFNLRPFPIDLGGVKMEESSGGSGTGGDALGVHEIDQVVSLVIEQTRKDVDNTCTVLGISPDPMQWSSADVKSWIMFTIQNYNLPPVPMEYFTMDGATLMAMSEEEFSQRAPQAGSTLYAQREIWKAARPEQWRGTPWQENQNPPAHTSSAPPPAPDDISDDEDSEGLGGSTASSVGKAPKTGGTHIHLWQFLKELLAAPHLHGSAIRWLDRSNGVFKIEDSVRVARLWGKRKNRPAMNYDKLSRSIRQYYKKGIMKKTERSQRLVYQFCHPYSL